MRKTIGINFTITRWMVFAAWKRTVIDSVTDHRNSSANWDEKREGKILQAWKTRPMCLHGLLFNLIGLLGEKLCTEPLPVEGKTVLQTRVSSQASVCCCVVFLISTSTSSSSSISTNRNGAMDGPRDDFKHGVFFVGKLAPSQPASQRLN